MLEWLGSPEFVGATLGVTGLNSIFTNMFNYGQQKEAMDYQKSLNQQIFEREDTALQRRMADAQAAGVNPYAVLGQSAGSGGKVSAPVAPQMKSGILDAINTGMSVYSNLVQTQKQKIDMDNAVKSGLLLDADLTQKLNQNDILGINKEMYQLDLDNAIMQTLDNMYYFNSMYKTNFQFRKSDKDNAVFQDFILFGDKNKFPDYFMYKDNPVNSFADWTFNHNVWDLPNTQYDLLKESLEQSKINTQIMNKENNWYNWNQGLNFGTSILDSVLGFLNFGQKQTFNSLNYGLQSNKNSFEQFKYFDSKKNPRARYYY